MHMEQTAIFFDELKIVFAFPAIKHCPCFSLAEKLVLVPHRISLMLRARPHHHSATLLFFVVFLNCIHFVDNKIFQTC